MTATQQVLLFLASVFALSYAESLYLQACSGGDPPEACLKFCELSQNGCIPPGKTLATKTFYTVCNQEQELQFDKELQENTNICQEYLDALSIRDPGKSPVPKEPNDNNQTKIALPTQPIDEPAQINNTNFLVALLTTIIGCLTVALVTVTSKLRGERQNHTNDTNELNSKMKDIQEQLALANVRDSKKDEEIQRLRSQISQGLVKTVESLSLNNVIQPGKAEELNQPENVD